MNIENLILKNRRMAALHFVARFTAVLFCGSLCSIVEKSICIW